jgi:hypothetical protein
MRSVTGEILLVVICLFDDGARARDSRYSLLAGDGEAAEDAELPESDAGAEEPSAGFAEDEALSPSVELFVEPVLLLPA